MSCKSSFRINDLGLNSFLPPMEGAEHAKIMVFSMVFQIFSFLSYNLEINIINPPLSSKSLKNSIGGYAPNYS